jgi:hypothetical protein
VVVVVVVVVIATDADTTRSVSVKGGRGVRVRIQWCTMHMNRRPPTRSNPTVCQRPRSDATSAAAQRVRTLARNHAVHEQARLAAVANNRMIAARRQIRAQQTSASRPLSRPR